MNPKFKQFILAKFKNRKKNELANLFLFYTLEKKPSVVHSFIADNIKAWAKEYAKKMHLSGIMIFTSDVDIIVESLQKKFAKELAKIV